jgi:hypothetical protein
VEKEVYQRIMKFQHEQELMQKKRFLQKVPPFDTWAESSLRAVAEVIQWKTFEAGEVIVEEGAIDPNVYFVRKGGPVDLFRSHEKRDKSTIQVKVAEISEFQYFNENLALDDFKKQLLKAYNEEIEGDESYDTFAPRGKHLSFSKQSSFSRRSSAAKAIFKKEEKFDSISNRNGTSSHAVENEAADQNRSAEARSAVTARVRGPAQCILGIVSLHDAKTKLFVGLELKPIYSYSAVVLERLARQQQEASQWSKLRQKQLNSIAREALKHPLVKWKDFVALRNNGKTSLGTR